MGRIAILPIKEPPSRKEYILLSCFDSIFSEGIVVDILLIEDDLIARKVATKILMSLGCQVMSANDGMTALDLIKQKFFSIIFIDLKLPDMDGYCLANGITALLQAQQRSSRLIALSAYVSAEDKKPSETAGIHQILEKPLNFEKAKKIIQAGKQAD